MNWGLCMNMVRESLVEQVIDIKAQSEDGIDIIGMLTSASSFFIYTFGDFTNGF